MDLISESQGHQGWNADDPADFSGLGSKALIFGQGGLNGSPALVSQHLKLWQLSLLAPFALCLKCQGSVQPSPNIWNGSEGIPLRVISIS